MGRVKLKIKRLENTSNRQVTYSKRRSGILKKARELSILCDIDLILLMFSPTGKPTLFRGERSNMDEVITKFAQLTPQERAKRKLESLEALKKTFKKLDHDVNIQDFLGASAQSVEELSNHARMLQAQIADVHKRLSCWANPDSIDNIEHLSQMEDSLRASLDRIHAHKEKLQNSQLIPLNCATQFQNDMNLPLMMGGVAQEGQPLSWLPDNDNQHIILPDATNFLPQRDIECSRDASSSFPSYSGCFFGSSSTETDIDNIQQQIDNSNNNNNTRQDGSASLNQLSSAACLNLQLDDHYSYNPYTNLNLSEVKEEQQMHVNPLDYQIDTDFELPRHIYDNVHHSCIPDSTGPCAIGMFADVSYTQQPSQL